MFSGFYTLGSGMLTQQRNLDVISNNIVNTQTPGYRADRMEISAFEKELLSRKTKDGIKSFGNGAPSAVVHNIQQVMTSGILKDTGRDMDVALDGEGFFTVQSTQDPNVTYLTRNGQFDVDEEGNLVLPGFGYVLDDGGSEITLEDTNFTVGSSGTIYDSEGEEVALLGVSMPTEESTLVKLDNGMFALQDGGETVLAEGYRTIQGRLELSNVNLNDEMSKLIETQRAYNLSSTAMQIVDSMNQKAATQIASV